MKGAAGQDMGNTLDQDKPLKAQQYGYTWENTQAPTRPTPLGTEVD
jgi:hypothetical protein